MANFDLNTDIGTPSPGTVYDKLRTPIYEVSVISSKDTSQRLTLPTQIARLISKVEIHEVYDVGCFHPLTISITFAEGSREPFSLTGDNADVNSLYSLGDDGSGSLTNLIGMLTDLKFITDSSGLTSVTAVEKLKFDATATNSPKDPQLTYVNNPTTASTGDYLFKQGNLIQVKWGYLESPDWYRTVAGVIISIQADYPDNDQPTLTITSQPLTTVFDQVTPIKGVPFSKASVLSGTTPTSFEDMTVQEVVQAVAKMGGFKTFISPDLLAKKFDKRHVKVWAGGVSLHEFLSELARKTLSVYEIELGEDGTYLLKFISRRDRAKEVKLHLFAPNLFAYKQPGTLLKSISVKVSFDTITTAAFTGINNKGDTSYYKAYHGGIVGTTTYSNHLFAPTNSTDSDSVAVQLADSLPSGDFSGLTSVKPWADDKTLMAESTAGHAGCMNKITSLEFTSLGFPYIKAGEPILVNNIGRRFSTVYYAQEVTHLLDAEGYVCRGTLLSALYAAHGQSSQNTTKQNIPDQVTVQQFNPL
jgi:hypothetical protein